MSLSYKKSSNITTKANKNNYLPAITGNATIVKLNQTHFRNKNQTKIITTIRFMRTRIFKLNKNEN